MYRSFVLVGLGGSGGKTIRFVKRELSKRLEEMGWDGGIPAAWQFLHIDTPTIPDGNELNDVVDQVGLDEYLGLVGDSVTFKGVTAELDSDPEIRNEMVGWRIDPANLAVPIGLGAGQFRAVGRTVAMAQGKEIRNRLKASFRRTADPGARSELTELFAADAPERTALRRARPTDRDRDLLLGWRNRSRSDHERMRRNWGDGGMRGRVLFPLHP